MDTSKLGAVLSGISKKGGLFKYGHPDLAVADTPEKVAKFYGLDYNKPYKGGYVLSSPDMVEVGRDQKNLKAIMESPRATMHIMPRDEFIQDHWGLYNIDSPANHLRPVNPGVAGALNALQPEYVSNIDMTKALGQAPKLYRAAYDMMRVGDIAKTYPDAINAVDMLTDVNRTRRTEHMLADAMHRPEDFNARILLADQQGTGAHPLAQALDEPNSALGRLALAQYFNTNRATGRELGESSRGIFMLDNPSEDVMSYAADIGQRFGGKGGVGESGARRALVTNQINRLLDSGASAEEVADMINKSSSRLYNNLFFKRGGLASVRSCA